MPCACTVYCCNPKLPICDWNVNLVLVSFGTVEKLITPPEAFPKSAELFERNISADCIEIGLMKSRAVLPSGSVSGIPSTKTRMPRVVPALERSPAPRAPNPRIDIRKS